MRTSLAIALGLAGCSYHPGSFTAPARSFPGERVTVGCLDVSVDRRPDREGSAVVDYQFGNRCDQPVTIDLLHVPVRGRSIEGEELVLTPYDPELAIRPLPLDGRAAGGEAIAYPSTVALAQVCVDAGAIEVPARGERWLCFAAREVVP